MAGHDDDPFALLEQTSTGTWAGWLGYRLGRGLERLPPDGERPVARPPAALARFESVCRCDGEGRWWVEAVDQPHPADVARWQDRLDRPAPTLAWSAGDLVPRPSRPDHVGAVEEAVRRIAAGQLYQANVCLRLETTFMGSPLGLWCEAGARLRPGRAAFVATDEGAVCSLSPEVFLLRHGRRVRSRPVKGTRALTETGRLDLAAAPKDRAEHVMIVDLVRNDLGRVCVPGTVRVARLLEAEALAGVWHLVSTVEGTLARGRGDADLVRACFPPGSVTGAPKVAAEALCCRLEPTAREAYCGAVGLASADHGIELNVAIRTFEVAGGRLWLGVGGGVVADSDGVDEWEECLAKAAPVLAAARLPPWDDPPTPRRGPAVQQEPGEAPAAGPCLETFLVADGFVVEGPARLARFRRSTGLDAGPAVEAAVGGIGAGTWRLRVDEVGGAPAVTVVPAPRPPVLDGGWSEAEVALVCFPGGLGDHKRADRAAVQDLERRVAPFVPVLFDEDGSVLEATWANVFAVIDNRLWTPPLDGRILPGVTRGVVLDEAVDCGVPLRIGRLGVEQLVAADAVLLTSAVAGLVRIRGIQGHRRLEEPHAIVATLARAVSRRWSAAGQRWALRRKML
ncbi:MAG: Para-aminobenzoate synthase, aminase component [uncultured Acidimicrobiales bacterium]|uniref:Para-aminobenzoate synthase, aminase component n=1 Tax=uncultured Acidimicrobiales bacterium TaxID=310071 RepID=A0A6J4II05_9ACTN|nr:MAG: Para-aminobenzoate synthase, aminase component [uncultured Acidimicrobiales bacterium]